MKTETIRFSAFASCVLALLARTHAQSTTSELIERARVVVTKLTSVPPRMAGVLVPSPPSTSNPSSHVVIAFGEQFVHFGLDGQLRGYADLSARTREEQAPGSSPLAVDANAFSAAERILGSIDEGGGFERKSIKRSRGLIYVGLAAKPYGYWSDGGNQALVTLMEGSGRVREVMLSRGWTFEPPNIHVTPEQAVDKAVAALGGSRANWQYRLEYTTWASSRAPAEIQSLHAKKTMRLHYNLWSDLRSAAYVDSVTGTLFDPITPEDWAERRVQRGLPPNDPIGKIDKISSGFSKVESRPVHPALLVGAGFGLGVAVFFAWSRLRTRKGH